MRKGTEIIPDKHSHTRIKPLALASGHGRYITVTPKRALVSVGEWPLHLAVKFLTVSLPKPPSGGFGSETAIWIRKWLKMSVETSRKLQLESRIVFQGACDGHGYRNMHKMPRGSDLNQGD